jgi:APA family basic amino acid/polyamine antiporter
VIGLIWFAFCFLYNILSAKIGGWFQEAAMVVKLIPLFAIAIGGLVFGEPIAAIQHPTPEAIEATKTLGWAAAIGPIAFSFDGWVVSMAVAHEVKNSKRNVPLALVAAPLFVLAAYLMYFLGSPDISDRRGHEDGRRVVAYAATNLIGPAFAGIIYVFVTISVMGTANGIFGLYPPALLPGAEERDPVLQFLKKSPQAQYAGAVRFLCDRDQRRMVGYPLSPEQVQLAGQRRHL